MMKQQGAVLNDQDAVFDTQTLGKDTEDGHYDPALKEIIGGRYLVGSLLGSGTFGRVFNCVDLKNNNTEMALKIIRAIDRYTYAGKLEIGVLNLIKTTAQKGPQHPGISNRSTNLPANIRYNYATNCNLVYIEESFEYRQHICIVFPKYGSSLLDLLRANSFRGFNIDWTRELSRSFMLGVSFFHSLGLIHTDIKLENIISRVKPIATRVRDRIFVHPVGADLVLIDVGSSVRVSDPKKPSLVCTRQYRAPENYLGIEFDTSLDVWSCGCVIFEILTGRTLFRTHNSVVHLMMMEKCIGPMTPNIAAQVSPDKCKYAQFYDSQNNTWLLPSDVPEAEHKHLSDMRSLEEDLWSYGLMSHTLAHLLRSMLQWDPLRRPTIDECLQHPFFLEEPKESRQVQTVASASEPTEETVMDQYKSLFQDMLHALSEKDTDAANEFKRRFKAIQ